MMVCEKCFNDVELKALIRNKNVPGKCSFGHGESYVLNLEELLDFFNELSLLFIVNPESRYTTLGVLQSDWNLFSDINVGHKILNKISTITSKTRILIETHVSYSEEIQRTVKGWDVLKKEIKYQSRYLTNIQPILDLGWDKLLGVKTELNPTKNFYRARIHSEKDKDCFSVSEMGAPLKEHSKPGRANVEGIPYLYLCNELETVFYEVRSSYLDEISVGKFKQKDQNNVIHIADFTYTPSLYSDDGELTDIVKSQLLRKAISADLSKPVRRYDSNLEYVPTQFICEFMRDLSNVDGVKYESSLRTDDKGTNIVIFKPELMECIDVKKYRISSLKIESKPIS